MYLPDVSAYFIAAGISWIAAQGIKYFLSKKQGQRNWRQLYASGSMPSAHTATMVALTTVVAVIDGLESGLFAVTTVVTAITAYDAMMARRAAGEQGTALQKLLARSPFAKDPMPHYAKGHQPIEVGAGAVLGLVIGLLVAFLITT